MVLPPRGYDYLRRHWPLIAQLLQTLRTLPTPVSAVLYGSVARGDDRDGSDIDLLVRLRRDGFSGRAVVREALEAATGRAVQLVGFAEAEGSPLLLADVLRDGRVLVDRDGEWGVLVSRARAIGRRARTEDRLLDDVAWAALDDLESA
jgi:predicted nucleotidyltransferase